ILAELLPSGITGSISTLPGGYRDNVKSEGQIAKIAGNLLSAAEHLDEMSLPSRAAREVWLFMQWLCRDR
ncbi:MAG: hypothetical protein NTV22_07835, partial [bacterium]|nr:hypothetical protein [bacterium]